MEAFRGFPKYIVRHSSAKLRLRYRGDTVMDCWWRKMCLLMIISSEIFLTMVFKMWPLPLPLFTAFITIWPSYVFPFSLFIAYLSFPRPRMRTHVECSVYHCIFHINGSKTLWSLVKGLHELITAPHLILAKVVSNVCHLSAIPSFTSQRETREIPTSLSFLTSLNLYVINIMLAQRLLSNVIGNTTLVIRTWPEKQNIDF